MQHLTDHDIDGLWRQIGHGVSLNHLDTVATRVVGKKGLGGADQCGISLDTPDLGSVAQCSIGRAFAIVFNLTQK